MKQCSECGQIKNYSEFYKGKRYKNGYRSSCKACCDVSTKKKQAIARRKYRESLICFCGAKLINKPYSKKYCSDKCSEIAKREYARVYNKAKHNTDEYRKWHREYMRKKLNINPSNYRV